MRRSSRGAIYVPLVADADEDLVNVQPEERDGGGRRQQQERRHEQRLVQQPVVPGAVGLPAYWIHGTAEARQHGEPRDVGEGEAEYPARQLQLPQPAEEHGGDGGLGVLGEVHGGQGKGNPPLLPELGDDHRLELRRPRPCSAERWRRWRRRRRRARRCCCGALLQCTCCGRHGLLLAGGLVRHAVPSPAFASSICSLEGHLSVSSHLFQAVSDAWNS